MQTAVKPPLFLSAKCRDPQRRFCIRCRSRTPEGETLRKWMAVESETDAVPAHEFICPFGAEWGCTEPPALPTRDAPKLTGGVGTELTKLLKECGVGGNRGCGCSSKARLMDNNGIEWCEKNIEALATWLVKAAKKRGWLWRAMPFKEVGAKMLLGEAIGRARANQ